MTTPSTSFVPIRFREFSFKRKLNFWHLEKMFIQNVHRQTFPLNTYTDSVSLLLVLGVVKLTKCIKNKVRLNLKHNQLIYIRTYVFHLRININ